MKVKYISKSLNLDITKTKLFKQITTTTSLHANLHDETTKELLTDFPVNPRRFKKFTKQLITLGPASNTVEMIEKLFLSGIL